MIQRIQSVYFFLSLLAVGIMFFVPLASIVGYSEVFTLSATGTFNSKGELLESAWPVTLLIAAEVVFSLVIIFLFKKRNLQMLLGKLNLLILTLLIALVFFYADHAKALSGLPNDTLVNYSFACLLPVISIILNYLAIRAIKKDEDLVRAADRLR